MIWIKAVKDFVVWTLTLEIVIKKSERKKTANKLGVVFSRPVVNVYYIYMYRYI